MGCPVMHPRFDVTGNDEIQALYDFVNYRYTDCTSTGKEVGQCRKRVAGTGRGHCAPEVEAYSACLAQRKQDERRCAKVCYGQAVRAVTGEPDHSDDDPNTNAMARRYLQECRYEQDGTERGQSCLRFLRTFAMCTAKLSKQSSPT
mmetsp:Transcript_35374/g.99709  ORF Transcript_35374/g.99709 Transcript_35374/m.99709 type:complete len:146 (+) Transcript_35374:183-620(+)